MILKRNTIFVCVGLRIVIGNHQIFSQQFSVKVMKHITSLYIIVFLTNLVNSLNYFFIFSPVLGLNTNFILQHIDLVFYLCFRST